MIGLVVSAQLLTALVLNQFGLLGLERRPLDVTRAIGAALIAAGAFLLQWRAH